MSTLQIIAAVVACTSAGFCAGWVFGGAYARKAFAEYLEAREGNDRG